MSSERERVPEWTSAEGLERFVGGKPVAASRGEAWRDVTVWIVAPPSKSDTIRLPSVSEPFLAWTISGEVDFEEREGDGPWIATRIRKGSFFLTYGGAPYDVRWQTVTDEPFQAMMVFLGLPLLERAFEEVFGSDAEHAELQDASGFADEALSSLLERLRDELEQEEASALLVQGVAQAIAVHLARAYATTVEGVRSGSSSLPGYKLRQVTEWMASNLSEELNLDLLAERVGLSKYYFHRLFKHATGMSPSHYQRTLRMTEARRLLRETDDSIVSVAISLGYANPSHFAQLFRKETGLSPSDFRAHH